jgi:hypothetical protein
MSNLEQAIEAVNTQLINQAKTKKCDYCTRPAEYGVESENGFTTFVCYMDKYFMADDQSTFYRLTQNGRGY